MRKLIAVSCILMMLPFAAHASNTPEEVISKGVKAYLEGNANHAVAAWIAGSALEGEKQTMMQANVLTQIQTMYGNVTGHDVVEREEITDRVSVVRIILNFEKGPVFGSFQMYRDSEDEWVVATFKFHTDIDMIW